MAKKQIESKEINYDFEISPDYDGTTGQDLLYAATIYRQTEMEIIRVASSRSFSTARKQIKKLHTLLKELEKHQYILDKYHVYDSRRRT